MAPAVGGIGGTAGWGLAQGGGSEGGLQYKVIVDQTKRGIQVGQKKLME